MNKKKRAVIFGTGSFSEVVTFMLTHDSEYDVVAYIISAEHVAEDVYLNKPVVSFEKVEQYYPPDECEIFIAIGCSKMNKVREQFIVSARQKGYKLLSYISSRAQHWGDIIFGDNVFILENNNIQPFVKIGDGTILWSGNHIGHHSIIGNYCFITSHVVISGHCRVGSHVFMGVNSTLIDNIAIAEATLIGAGALISKSTKPGEVYIGSRQKALERTSEVFF